MWKLALFRNFLMYSKLNNINAKKKKRKTNYFLLFVKGVLLFFYFLNTFPSRYRLLWFGYRNNPFCESLGRKIYWRCRKLLFYCSYFKPTLKDTMWCVIDSSGHSWLVSCESMWEVGTATSQWEWSFLAADWVRAMAISIKIAEQFVGVYGINTASDISKLFYSISRVDR